MSERVRPIVFVGEYEMFNDYTTAEKRAKELAEDRGHPVHIANIVSYQGGGGYPIIRVEAVLHVTTGEAGEI